MSLSFHSSISSLKGLLKGENLSESLGIGVTFNRKFQDSCCFDDDSIAIPYMWHDITPDNCSAYQFITGFEAKKNTSTWAFQLHRLCDHDLLIQNSHDLHDSYANPNPKKAQRIRCNFATNARDRKGTGAPKNSTNTKNKSHRQKSPLKTNPSPTKHLSQQPRQLLWGCKCPGNEIAELVSHLLLITMQQWVYRRIL